MRPSATGAPTRRGLRGAAGVAGERLEELADHDLRRAVEQAAADGCDLAADLGVVVVGDPRAAVGPVAVSVIRPSPRPIAERADDRAGERHAPAAASCPTA